MADAILISSDVIHCEKTFKLYLSAGIRCFNGSIFGKYHNFQKWGMWCVQLENWLFNYSKRSAHYCCQKWVATSREHRELESESSLLVRESNNTLGRLGPNCYLSVVNLLFPMSASRVSDLSKYKCVAGTRVVQ